MIDNIAVLFSCLGALLVAWRAFLLDTKTPWFPHSAERVRPSVHQLRTKRR
jgi:hypothetical protein